MKEKLRFNAESLEEVIEMERAGDRGLVSAVVGDFLGKFDARLEMIECALLTAQWAHVEFLAHALGSSCFFLGLERSGHLAHAIEIDAREHVGSLDAIFSLRVEIDLAAQQMEFFVHTLSSFDLPQETL